MGNADCIIVPERCLAVEAKMVVRNQLCLGQTLVPNAFIDKYLPAAGGDAVKVYIMLLRMSDSETPTVARLADTLDLTERAVIRALGYWRDRGLIETEFEGSELTQITLLSPVIEDAPAAGTEPGATAAGAAVSSTPAAASVPAGCTQQGVAAQAGSVAISQGVAAQAGTAETSGTAGPSTGRQAGRSRAAGPAAVKVDVNDLRFRQLIYVAEQFLGRTLTRNDTNFIVWLQEDMGFSYELTEYLLEYCVDKGHKTVSYMRAVAIGWKNAGVRDVESARAEAAGFDENARRGSAKGGTNKFHNFTQRDTDLNALIIDEIRDGDRSAG